MLNLIIEITELLLMCFVIDHFPQIIQLSGRVDYAVGKLIFLCYLLEMASANEFLNYTLVYEKV